MYWQKERKNMVKTVEQYRKKIKCKLHCTASVKDQLLNKFDKMLMAYLEDNPSPSIEELITAFGPAEETAKMLMEEVSQQEILVYRKQQTLKRVLSAVLAAIFIFFAIYSFFWKEKPLVAVDDNTDFGTSPVETEYVE